MMKIALGVSGSGRSLENLVEHTKSKSTFSIAALFSSNEQCRALEIARKNNIPSLCLDFSHTPESELQRELYAFLLKYGAELIVLAGFLKKMPLHDSWRDRIINIHPALLPKFGGPGMYGDRVHKAVLKSLETETGATVHFVNAEYDEGKIISQILVPVKKDDDHASLAKRVFAAECKLLPHVIDGIASHLYQQDSKIERLIFNERL